MTGGEPHAATDARSVVYVYGVAPAARGRRPASLQLEGIVPQAPVQPLVHGNLMAFVSAVPAGRFGASQFQSALNDTECLKERILAHETVLEQLRSCYNVVPFRFGTIYLNSAHVANALARHRTELRRALGRIRGAAEWGVKLYCDRDRLRRRLEAESDGARLLHDQLGTASPGARFFLQKKYDRLLDGMSVETAASLVQRIRHSLDACARESAEIDVQPPAVHSRPTAMIMNASYLVAAKALPQFRQTIATLQEEYAAHGFDAELTGPWPPYHFASIRQEGNADAPAARQ